MDLHFILENNLKQIIKIYGSFVDCVRTSIEEKGVTAEALCMYLLSVSAFSTNRQGHTLALLSDKKSELQKATTVIEIFNILITECASFLNYDIFQDILEKYDINADQKELKYSEHLKAYMEKHKISEFAAISPLLNSRKSSKELTLKYDVESTSRLAKVADLRRFLASIPVADAIFAPNTVLTAQQERDLQAASVLWLECNGYTFNGREGHPVNTESSSK